MDATVMVSRDILLDIHRQLSEQEAEIARLRGLIAAIVISADQKAEVGALRSPTGRKSIRP